MKLHHALFGAYELQAHKHEPQMSAAEIFSFVTKKLERQEELKTTVGPTVEKSNQPTTPTMRVVTPATAGQNAVQYAKGGSPEKPRGGTPSPSGRTAYPKAAGGRPSTDKEVPDTSVCLVCKKAGRLHVHDFRDCQHFKKAADEFLRQHPRPSSVCLTCQRKGKQADHDYRGCRELWTTSVGIVKQIAGERPVANYARKAQ